MVSTMSAWENVQKALSRLKDQEKTVNEARKTLGVEEERLQGYQMAFLAARDKFYKEHPEMVDEARMAPSVKITGLSQSGSEAGCYG